MATRTENIANAPDLEKTTDPLVKRASELALNHGRTEQEVTDADVTWAKRELKPMKISSPRVEPFVAVD